MSFSKHWNAVLGYIFENEADDFLENPSDGHVYYHAIFLEFGEVAAQSELKAAQESLGEACSPA